MRCLILGGGGFIGSFIADRMLSLGHPVRIFERPRVLPYRAFGREERVDWFAGDFQSAADIQAAVEDCSVVFHMVSTTLPKSSNDDPIYDVESNVVGTLRLLAAAGTSTGSCIFRRLGLFDRPADAACLAALRAVPAIFGLTDALFSHAKGWSRFLRKPVPIDEKTWNITLQRLADGGLIYPVEGNSTVDAHPLVREYFGKQPPRAATRGLARGPPAALRAPEGKRAFEVRSPSNTYGELQEHIALWPRGHGKRGSGTPRAAWIASGQRAS